MGDNTLLKVNELPTRTGSETAPETRRKAARYVAGCARDAADLALLLDALGLTAADTRCARPAGPTAASRQPGPRGGMSRMERNALVRERTRQDPSRADRAGHGKYTTYINHGCRCEPCCEDHAQYQREYRQRRAIRKAVTP